MSPPPTGRTLFVTRVANRFSALIVLNGHHHNSEFISRNGGTHRQRRDVDVSRRRRQSFARSNDDLI